MDEHEHVHDNPLFVFKVTTSCKKCLKKLEKGLLECYGNILSVEVDEEKQDVHVRGNVEPLELITKTQTIMENKAKLSYYNKDPSRIHDLQSESNGKEKYSGGTKDYEDHYKPYVYKEHKPFYYPSSMSGKEFFHYFGGVRSETRKRNAGSTVDPFVEFPDYSHSKHLNSAVPMPSWAHHQHFY